MKWLILGANGQLGQELLKRLGSRGIGTDRRTADVKNPLALEACLEWFQPDGVINCSAYNLVDRAEDFIDDAFAVNSIGTRNIALLCKKRSIKLLHYSTDHVFCGTSTEQRPFTENDPPQPANVYGLSKLVGEYWVRMLVEYGWVVRTCGLYGCRGAGGKGTNFVETMLRLANEGKTPCVVNDQFCTPTPATELAEASLLLLEEKPPGLYHLTSTGHCSWFEFAQTIYDEEGIGVTISPISTHDLGSRAKRPAWSVLGSDEVVAQELGLRPWREGLAAYLKGRVRTI